MSAKHLRFLTWNLNNFTRGRRADKAALLATLDWDVAALQEVDRKTFGSLCEMEGVTGHLAALDCCESPSTKANHHGCALLARNGLTFDDARTLPAWQERVPQSEVPFPERCLSARLVGWDRDVSVVSFHAPHAAAKSPEERAWRVARKNEAYGLVSEHLAGQTAAVIGLDGNVWTDPIDLCAANLDAEQHELERFHLADPPHGLRDAFRTWLDAQPEEKERVATIRPEGPLEVTYQRGKHSHPKVDRMDRIYASPVFDVSSVHHAYADALSVGSDHAYVLAELRIN